MEVFLSYSLIIFALVGLINSQIKISRKLEAGFQRMDLKDAAALRSTQSLYDYLKDPSAKKLPPRSDYAGDSLKNPGTPQAICAVVEETSHPLLMKKWRTKCGFQ